MKLRHLEPEKRSLFNTTIAKTLGSLCTAAVVFAFSYTPAKAQDDQTGQTGNTQSGMGTETIPAGQPLPPPQSDNDPMPPVATPVPAEAPITEQAGVGGSQGYGRAGVLELGGGLGITGASDFFELRVTPFIGWFFMDNVQISARLGLHYADTGEDSSTYLTVLAEPSVHIPFNQMLFGFVGVGAGVAYADGPGAGFAIAPRLGMNIMVGRSGIFTPAFELVYSTADVVETSSGTAVAVDVSYGFNAGFTVMW